MWCELAADMPHLDVRVLRAASGSATAARATLTTLCTLALQPHEFLPQRLQAGVHGVLVLPRAGAEAVHVAHRLLGHRSPARHSSRGTCCCEGLPRVPSGRWPSRR